MTDDMAAVNRKYTEARERSEQELLLMGEPIMQYFAYEHLPPKLQEVSRQFCELAVRIHVLLPRNAERAVALRKLLEGKDAAVRALIAR